jgi:hypothetical protein
VARILWIQAVGHQAGGFSGKVRVDFLTEVFIFATMAAPHIPLPSDPFPSAGSRMRPMAASTAAAVQRVACALSCQLVFPLALGSHPSAN